MGSVPALDSIKMSDQIMPVEMCTDATCEMLMLSSLLPNSRGLMRDTRCGVTTMRVGNKKLPLVQRLAINVSPVGGAWEIVGLLLRDDPRRFRSTKNNRRITNDEQGCFYTHSSAPFFQIQMYPTIRISKKTSISTSPNTPRALNFTAHGNRKIVSTSKTTNRMATI